MENKVQVQDHSQEILSVIRSNASPGILRNKLEDYHENDLADIFPELTLAERRKICRILDTDMLSDIFEHIDQKQAAEYLDEMDVKKAAAILSAMETDAVVDVLKMTSKEKRSLLTELLDDDAKKDIAVIAYVRVVSSLFEAASTVVAPLHPASLFTPSKLPAASPPASTAHKLNVRPFFAIFLILSFLLSLFIIIKSLHESMSFIYVIYLSLFPFDAFKYRNDLCSLCGKNVFNL